MRGEVRLLLDIDSMHCAYTYYSQVVYRQLNLD